MKHTYKVSGMTCTGCQAKVQHLLSQVKGVSNVTIDLEWLDDAFSKGLVDDLEAACCLAGYNKNSNDGHEENHTTAH